MPDWSYHTFFKPILFKIAPKSARTLTLRTMNTLVSLPYGHHIVEFFGHMASSNVLRKNVCGVEVASPIGLSGQVDPSLSGTRALSRLGVGYLEVGPVTYERVDQPNITLHKNEEMIEYYHLNENPGVTSIEKVLSEIHIDIPVLIRISKSSLEQTLSIIDQLKPYASWFVIEPGYDLDSMSLIRKETDSPLFMTYTNEFDEKITDIVDGFYLPEGIAEGNIYRVGPFELQGHTEKVKQLSHLGKPIIVSGGVHQPEDSLALLDAGADLIQLHSGFIFSGPGLPKRINEAITNRSSEVKPNQKGWIPSFLMGLGVFIAGLIACFIGLTDVLLAPDEAFLGMSKQEIQQFSEHLFRFMSHDRISLAGVMISAGFLYMMLACHGIRNGKHWSRKVFYIAATLGFLNFFYFFGFGYLDPLHMLYNALILPLFICGFFQTRKMPPGSDGANLKNTSAWRKSLFGQSMFIVLGSSFFMAGVVISYIGLTDVFVKEDLNFLQLEPEHIHEHNHHFISLIAHDRAGFGGALISVGILIALIAMWGFREGERWIWWTLTLGGIPGFVAGIGIHYHIGYVDQYHLAPAYFAILLYVLGVTYSYPYLMKKNVIQSNKTTELF